VGIVGVAVDRARESLRSKSSSPTFTRIAPISIDNLYA